MRRLRACSARSSSNWSLTVTTPSPPRSTRRPSTSPAPRVARSPTRAVASCVLPRPPTCSASPTRTSPTAHARRDRDDRWPCRRPDRALGDAARARPLLEHCIEQRARRRGDRLELRSVLARARRSRRRLREPRSRRPARPDLAAAPLERRRRAPPRRARTSLLRGDAAVPRTGRPGRRPRSSPSARPALSPSPATSSMKPTA